MSVSISVSGIKLAETLDKFKDNYIYNGLRADGFTEENAIRLMNGETINEYRLDDGCLYTTSNEQIAIYV